MERGPSGKHVRRALFALAAAAACLQLQSFLYGENNYLNDASSSRRSLAEEEYPEVVMPDWLRLRMRGDGNNAASSFVVEEYEDGNRMTMEGESAGADELESIISEMASSFSPPVHAAALSSFNLEDLVDLSNNFAEVFAIVVYDPPSDEFLLMYDKGRMEWTSGATKLHTSFEGLAFALRKSFPDRFAPDQPELALAMSSGDYPHLSSGCLKTDLKAGDGCERSETPVLQFGSAFRDKDLLPNMIPMPMPDLSHLACFRLFAASGGSNICPAMRPKVADELVTSKKSGMMFGNGRLVFGDEMGLEFEDLIPQLVWRGTDFGYLTKETSLNPPVLEFDKKTDEVVLRVTERTTLADWVRSGLRKKRYKAHYYTVAGQTASEPEKRRSASDALLEAYDRLIPRWKAVALTAAAELDAEAEGDGSLPWANMKFSKMKFEIHGMEPRTEKKRAEIDEMVRLLEEYGVPYKGQGMSLQELARYKYHIDLGGGGGTTWTGTTQKLAMPGLLFHHVTPTKDYIHDRMEPWVHYVPVKPDLSDLHEKIIWAESNPQAAKLIAQQSTMLMRELGSAEGFGSMYRDYFVEPLRAVVEAYRPVSPETSWRDVLGSFQGGEKGHRFEPTWHCTGKLGDGQCYFSKTVGAIE